MAFFWGAYFAILFVAAFPRAMVPPAWAPLVWGLISTPAILALTVLVIRREHRRLADVGVSPSAGSAGRFLVGLLIGAANYGLIILTLSLLITPLRLTPVTPLDGGAILLKIAIVLVLAAMEELGFRGYPLRTLLPVLGAWRSHALVAVAFGVAHFAFGWDWQPVVFGVVPSALLFGAAAQASGGLAMPIGLHAAMNLAREAVGEAGTPGLWTIAMDAQAAGRLATWAPWIGLVVTLVVTASLWIWDRRRRPVATVISA